MPGGFRRTGVESQLLLALMLCALFARAWIPAGWMPDRTASGYTISLCTGMGAVTAWIDEQGAVHKNKPLKSGTDDQPCAFAGMFTVAAMLDHSSALAAIIPALRLRAFLPVYEVAIGRGLAAPPPPPTGPPTNL